MPRYAIVIKDSKKAHAQEITRNVAANVTANPSVPVGIVEKRVTEIVGAAKPVGTIHAIMDSACPDGLPNCRNCGDPQHTTQCQKNGHCPHCGTRHGIAPDSVLKANGYELVKQN